MTLADTGSFASRYGAFDGTLSVAEAVTGSALTPKEPSDNHKKRSIFSTESILKQASGLKGTRQNVVINSSLIVDMDFLYSQGNTCKTLPGL